MCLYSGDCHGKFWAETRLAKAVAAKTARRAEGIARD
jgi:hypothetical protein